MAHLKRSLRLCACVLLVANTAAAEVVRIDVRRRDDFGTYERVIGRVHFAIDPSSRPTAASPTSTWRRETPRARSSSQPTCCSSGRRAGPGARHGVPRSGQSRPRSVARHHERRAAARPVAGIVGPRGPVSAGAGICGRVSWLAVRRAPSEGLTFEAPFAPVEGVVRESYVESVAAAEHVASRSRIARPSPAERRDADVSREDGRHAAALRATRGSLPTMAARCGWNRSASACTRSSTRRRDRPSPASAWRPSATSRRICEHGAAGRHASRRPGRPRRRIIGYGYSQSGRLLREFVRDGFNADERGRAVFDGADDLVCGRRRRQLQPSLRDARSGRQLRAVGAAPGRHAAVHRRWVAREGQGSRGHAEDLLHVLVHRVLGARRFAAPTRATMAGRTCRWRRHRACISSRGRRIRPACFRCGRTGTVSALHQLRRTAMGRSARCCWISMRGRATSSRAAAVAVSVDLEGRAGGAPGRPLSRRAVVSVYDLYAAGVADGLRTRLCRHESDHEWSRRSWARRTGVLVPQVNADGNDVGGVRLPELAVPLGTYTGWNVTIPQLADCGICAGLVGGFEPFPLTKGAREQSGDTRVLDRGAIREPSDYLERVEQAANDLVRQRFMRSEDIPAVVRRAGQMWDAVAAIRE